MRAEGGHLFLREQVRLNAVYVATHRDAFNARRRTNFRHQVNRIKQQARNRNYVFELSDDDVHALLHDLCVYCGAAPDPFNTIDRMDNAVGYVLTNVVTCCKTCNMTKGCLDPLTYVERCKHIAFVHTGEGQAYPHSLAPTKLASVTMAIYQRSAKKKGLEFALSDAEFERLTNANCTYCDQPTTRTHRNGIDRVDSTRGYVADNCATCCGQCNIAKKKLARDQFVEHACTVARTPHPDFGHVTRCPHIITRRAKM
jgi:5-methylcytosine-specific restriction endonuclease McrA